MFATDQAGSASRHQVAEIAAGAPPQTTTTVTDAHPGQPRAFIDGAAKALTAPFRAVLHSGSQWAQEIFATVCALLLYGVGLGYIARFSQGSAGTRYRPDRGRSRVT